MTAKDIQGKLCYYMMWQVQNKAIGTNMNFLLPYECDVVSLSNSDYLTEYEIKVSRSDFFADFKKGANRYMPKHVALKQREVYYGGSTYKQIANRFYFVVPEDLVRKEEVPDYAGLIYVSARYESNIRFVKKAPFLHKRKATQKEIEKIMRNTSQKYSRELLKSN